MSNNQVKNSSILLVEDNSFYKNTVERILKQEGFNNIKTADNGLEAMTILDTEKIDAVLLDIDMPVMNGYEVLQKIKSSKHLRDIPVIVIPEHLYLSHA